MRDAPNAWYASAEKARDGTFTHRGKEPVFLGDVVETSVVGEWGSHFRVKREVVDCGGYGSCWNCASWRVNNKDRSEMMGIYTFSQAEIFPQVSSIQYPRA